MHALPGFRELPAHRLAQLGDEQLVEYLREAREAGRHNADWWQKEERTVQTRPLPQPGDEEFAGHEPAVAFEGDAMHARECVRLTLDELPAAHREVVRLYVLGPHEAAEAAALAGEGMTEANVHQIASRFQKRVRERLEGGHDSG